MTRSLPGKFMKNSKGLREGFPFFLVGGRVLNRKILLWVQVRILGSFSIDDGNCSENVSFEMNSRFFNLSRVYSSLLKMASVGEFPWS